MDFAEQLESVAYVVCGEGTIPFEKFRRIWQVKGVNIGLTVHELQIKLFRVITYDSFVFQKN